MGMHVSRRDTYLGFPWATFNEVIITTSCSTLEWPSRLLWFSMWIICDGAGAIPWYGSILSPLLAAHILSQDLIDEQRRSEQRIDENIRTSGGISSSQRLMFRLQFWPCIVNQSTVNYNFCEAMRRRLLAKKLDSNSTFRYQFHHCHPLLN